MEFKGLKRQYITIQDEIKRKLEHVLQKGTFIMGEEVSDLEAKLAEFVGRKYCVTCASGTDALELSLLALGIGAGDIVFVPDFTFFATAEAVCKVGATPVFVDIDKKTFNLSVESLISQINRNKSQFTDNMKAIITVDLFGQPADYKAITEIAKEYGLFIIEDAAQGFGSKYDGHLSCGFGDISATSFFPAKPLGCYGDGGAIFMDDMHYYKLISSLKVHGKGENKYDNIRIGYNSRLDEIQAAILNVKFDIFRAYECEKVNESAMYYTNLLHPWVETPYVLSNAVSSWAQYSIKLKSKKERDGVQKYLSEHNIPSMIYYQKPLHKQEAFNHSKYDDSWYLNAVDASDRILSLPIHAYLKNEEIEKVSNTIISYLESNR